jgi:hypothetical protein
VGKEDMSEYIQKGYIRIADIIPIWDDIRIADIPTLSEIHLETFSKYITPHFWTLRLLRRNTFKAKMYIEANRKWLI